MEVKKPQDSSCLLHPQPVPVLGRARALCGWKQSPAEEPDRHPLLSCWQPALVGYYYSIQLPPSFHPASTHGRGCSSFLNIQKVAAERRGHNHSPPSTDPGQAGREPPGAGDSQSPFQRGFSWYPAWNYPQQQIPGATGERAPGAVWEVSPFQQWVRQL